MIDESSGLKIKFRKVTGEDKQYIFRWLAEPHVKAFWDNSQNHRDDIAIFADGRQEPSPYFNGIFTYWIGLVNDEPFCLIMTSEIAPSQTDLSELWRSHLSKKGKTFSLDFMIGNPKFLGKGLGSPTLESFIKFVTDEVDPAVDTFFIDPEESNTRAKHVYEKAGFECVSDFRRDGNGRKDVRHFLMIKTR